MTPQSVLDSMVGHRLPGGCDSCDAYQIVTRSSEAVFVLTVRHDHGCPDLAEAEQQ